LNFVFPLKSENWYNWQGIKILQKNMGWSFLFFHFLLDFVHYIFELFLNNIMLYAKNNSFICFVFSHPFSSFFNFFREKRKTVSSYLVVYIMHVEWMKTKKRKWNEEPVMTVYSKYTPPPSDIKNTHFAAQQIKKQRHVHLFFNHIFSAYFTPPFSFPGSPASPSLFYKKTPWKIKKKYNYLFILETIKN
jgi:hypothetical protein